MSTSRFLGIFRSIIALSIIMLVVDCGGGGGGGSSNPTQSFNISGTISGDYYSSVTVTLSGDSSKTTTTDIFGNYSFSGLTNGSYTITPSQSGYTFNPASKDVAINGSNSTLNNFSSIANPAPTYSISGRIIESGGSSLQGVTVTLSGTSSDTTTTDTSGNYSFVGLENGAYIITVSFQGYTLNPTSQAVTINGANSTGINFTAEIIPIITYNISGIVLTSSGIALREAPITLLNGMSTHTAFTDEYGMFTFSGLANGSYTITPSLAGYTFTPGSRIVNINGANIFSVNFTSTNAYPIGSYPRCIAIDSSGNVWISDSVSLNKLSSVGVVLGTFAAGSGAMGIAIDDSDNVWITKYASASVIKFSSAGNVLGNYPVGNYPEGIAIDGSGNVWVANSSSNNVTKLSSNGDVLGTYDAGTTPQKIAIDGSDNVWITNINSKDVTKLSSSGTLIGTYPANSDPLDIAIDSSGNVWIANYTTDFVTKLSPAGDIIGIFDVNGTESRGIAIDGSNNVWVVNSGYWGVTKLNSSGVVLQNITVLDPWCLAIDNTGNVWIPNFYDHNTVTKLVGVASPVITPLLLQPK